ncbi:RHS repeat-associated core domain protein [Pseudanabaena biceps PCC 7429]|uniref:RHS repeat-associated core domain protein n=2 Tax=Pseudanabaena TaxID=1152 RepID=L8MZN9_9CYAN|nr:RHS repeat-associated core domain protein [Pseudanabaena biceps PCC 7429]
MFMLVQQVINKKRYAGSDLVVDTNHVYDQLNRFTNITHSNGTGANTIASYSQNYDQGDRITGISSNDGNSSYTYDDTNQLVSGEYDFQDNESYSYDSNGNRTNDGYVTGINNQLLEDNKYLYEYDLVGNRTKRTDKSTNEVMEYRWDIRDRLTGITVKNALGEIIRTAEYTYDVYNQRIAKTVDTDGDGSLAAVTERFVYGSDQNIALVFDENGNVNHRYLFGNGVDQIEADENDGNTRWALTDHLGSVRDIVDDSGTVLNHVVYDAFGGVTSQTDESVVFRYGYTARELDAESGLQYNRARYLDSFTGKFISEDPISFKGGDSNLYRYVFNSPVDLTDPIGLRPINQDELHVLSGLRFFANETEKTDPVLSLAQKQGLPSNFARDLRKVADDLQDYILRTQTPPEQDPDRIKAAFFALNLALSPDANLYHSKNASVPAFGMKVRAFQSDFLHPVVNTCNRFVGDAFALGADRKYGEGGTNSTYPTYEGELFRYPYPISATDLADPNKFIPRLPILQRGEQKLGDIISFDTSAHENLPPLTYGHTGILLNHGLYISARDGYTPTKGVQFDGVQISRIPTYHPYTFRRFIP